MMQPSLDTLEVLIREVDRSSINFTLIFSLSYPTPGRRPLPFSPHPSPAAYDGHRHARDPRGGDLNGVGVREERCLWPGEWHDRRAALLRRAPPGGRAGAGRGARWPSTRHVARPGRPRRNSPERSLTLSHPSASPQVGALGARYAPKVARRSVVVSAKARRGDGGPLPGRWNRVRYKEQ